MLEKQDSSFQGIWSLQNVSFLTMLVLSSELRRSFLDCPQ